MTEGNHAADRDVVAWLFEDGPTEAPDHLVELTLAIIPGIRRTRPLDNVLRAAMVAAAAVIVASAIGAGIAGLRGRDVGPPPAPASSSPSASPATSGGPEGDAPCPPHQIACGRSLASGVTYPTAFDPAVTLSVPDDHWLAASDQPGQLLLWTVADPRRRVGLYRDPRAIESDGTSAAVGGTPADLLTWVQGHPELIVGEQQPVRLAGLDGLAIDLALREGATTRTERCPAFDTFACFPLFAGSGQGWDYELGVTTLSHFRLHLFDLPGGGVLLVTLEAHHAVDLEAFAERAAPVLESLRLAD